MKEELIREYGGYLPLELPYKREYYHYDSNHMVKTNSGTTALCCALMAMKPKKVSLPYFICPTVDHLLSQLNIPTTRYHIDDTFRPVGLNDSEDACGIVDNYFGLCTSLIKDIYPKFKHVIIDNTQSFFSEPVLAETVYNIYSCRKFIGTSDGGYLIGNNLPAFNLEKDLSAERSAFLLMQYEVGTNGAYRSSLSSYDQVKGQRRRMSNFTERLLSSVDYDVIKRKRRRNFLALHKRLRGTNRLHFNFGEKDVPYSYPYMIHCDIRSRLIENRIYVPWIWKEKAADFRTDQPEFYFSNIYHLPVDQRYDEEDMHHLAEIVLRLVKESASGNRI